MSTAFSSSVAKRSRRSRFSGHHALSPVDVVVRRLGEAERGGASTRSQPLENVGGINEPARIHIGLRLTEGCMQRHAVGIVEPIPWIQRQQLQFGALRQVRRLVNDKTRRAPAP
jgi:hypothetical protein